MAPSLSSRLVKTPKVFLCDTGLAARHQGWNNPEQLSASPQAGALFENQVLLEVLKARDHHGLPWSVHHWRTRDGEEVELVVESTPGRRVALEGAPADEVWSPSIELLPSIHCALTPGGPDGNPHVPTAHPLA